MFSSFAQAIRPYIPVIAHVKQKAVTKVVPKPKVGVRWGNPSRFEFDELNRLDDGLEDKFATTLYTFEDLHKRKDVRGEEVYRKWEKVRAEAVDDPSVAFEFERPKEMYFYTHETEVREDVEKDTSTEYVKYIQPEITKTRHYIKFSFPLSNPEDTIIASGERGEHPDVSLERRKEEGGQTAREKTDVYWER